LAEATGPLKLTFYIVGKITSFSILTIQEIILFNPLSTS
jgi:hypothetical protein